jgi:hypothetical protein
MTYRTDNHHGVTIVREGVAPRPGSNLEQAGSSAELVAVVVNGDQELAERICALLNGERPGVVIDLPADLTAEEMAKFVAAFNRSVGKSPVVLPRTPDVDHARGAAEGPLRSVWDTWDRGYKDAYDALASVSDDAGNAPAVDYLAAGVTGKQAMEAGAPSAEACGAFTNTYGERGDAPSAPLGSPLAAEQPSVVGPDGMGGPDASASAYPGQFFWGAS